MNRKYILFLCLLLVSDYPLNECQRRYYSRENSKTAALNAHFPKRIFNLMVDHYEDISRKMEFISYIRYIYEESPQYEMGYVMNEIIERYRKMVEHLKRPIMFKSDAVFDTIKRIELIEKLYFEIYHLVNIMHEIPRKFSWKEKQISKGEHGQSTEDPASVDHSQRVRDAQDHLIRNSREREKRKKIRLKQMKKMRELYLKYQNFSLTTIKPKNEIWPIDYGWEIDYFW